MLADVAGQQRAIGFLRRLLEKEAVPHALLFTGMAGSGKMHAAMQFAKALNCLSPLDFDSCGVCNSCRKLENAQHPDVLHIRHEGVYIKLEQIRDLVKRFRFRPFEGKFRVVIIEDAQRLMESAANAMLKILEEPPKANILILLATESQMLLPTIVSRCCQVRFQPLKDKVVADRLMREGLSAEQAAGIARMAAGSYEKARLFSGLYPALSATQREKEDGTAEDSKAEAGWRKVIERLESLEAISILDFFPMVSDWAKERENAEQDLELIRLWVRDLILFRFTCGPKGGREPQQHYAPPAAGRYGPSPATLTFELNDRTKEAARSAPPARLFFLYHNVEQAMQGLKVNANLQMTLEGVCLAIKDSLYGKGDWSSFPEGGQALPL